MSVSPIRWRWSTEHGRAVPGPLTTGQSSSSGVRFLLVLCLSLTHVSLAWSQEDGRVLRHAVFFKFKESAGVQDVQRVLAAFEQLPAKIESILDFQWGVRINDDATSGGFTHCFLITFPDEAGRDEYLPHADHQAFAAMLGPYLADVFVIDYWGLAGQTLPKKALRHAVFLKFKEDASQDDIAKAVDAFAALPQAIDAIHGFEWGVNNSPETHDDGFTHAFLVTFRAEDGLATYGPDPAHQALVQVLSPVVQEVRVLDFWTDGDD